MEGIDEEGRQLLRRIVEKLAWRQIASINILGHCLKHVVDLDDKLQMATELDLSLRLFHEIRSLYRELGWEDLESAVRDDAHRWPYPSSRMEFDVAYHLIGLAEQVAMKSYVGSRSKQFAAIALSYVDAAQHRARPTTFVEYASDPSNRPRAQEFLDRWLQITLVAFGRPRVADEDRAVGLGLRTKGTAEMAHEYLGELAPFLASCHLTLPSLEELEIELSAS